MSVKTASTKIKGKTALLMHRFPMNGVKNPEKKTREEQAEMAAYRDPDNGGCLYVPGINVQRSLIGAAAYSKGKGRASLMKPAAACILVSPERIGLGTKEYVIDSRPVVVPATKGRIIRHRPRIDEWELEFEIDFDDELLSDAQLRQILDDAGSRVGLLDFRPARTGPYGRFYVTYWKI